MTAEANPWKVKMEWLLLHKLERQTPDRRNTNSSSVATSTGRKKGCRRSKREAPFEDSSFLNEIRKKDHQLRWRLRKEAQEVWSNYLEEWNSLLNAGQQDRIKDPFEGAVVNLKWDQTVCMGFFVCWFIGFFFFFCYFTTFNSKGFRVSQFLVCWYNFVGSNQERNHKIS